jgi:hypothetical protein
MGLYHRKTFKRLISAHKRQKTFNIFFLSNNLFIRNNALLLQSNIAEWSSGSSLGS